MASPGQAHASVRPHTWWKRLLVGCIVAFRSPGSSRAFEVAGWCLVASPWFYNFVGGADFFRSGEDVSETDFYLNNTFFSRRGAGHLVGHGTDDDGREGAGPSANATNPAVPAVCPAVLPGPGREAAAADPRPRPEGIGGHSGLGGGAPGSGDSDSETAEGLAGAEDCDPITDGHRQRPLGQARRFWMLGYHQRRQGGYQPPGGAREQWTIRLHAGRQAHG